ncbi:c-type cytochrome [Noviherbaspirillum sp. ST9]|uniref:c-type cytochrome n=1 Tax=Noviherbaspirillum sp. ST9 TaxID=3401606 RepID=UPI003B58935F
MKQIRHRAVAAVAAFLLLSMGAAAQAQSMKIPKPSDGLMPNPGRGKGLFATHCASCHGADLKGSDKGPAMLHKVYEPSHHGDAAFQIAAARGVRAHHWQFGDMAPVPAVTPDDVAHITAFIRAEQRKIGIH